MTTYQVGPELYDPRKFTEEKEINSLANNPLFLGLLKRVEMLEARVNDMIANPGLAKQAELRFA